MHNICESNIINNHIIIVELFLRQQDYTCYGHAQTNNHFVIRILNLTRTNANQNLSRLKWKTLS